MLSGWMIALVLATSFIATQLLVICLQQRRLRRVERKSIQLCGAQPPDKIDEKVDPADCPADCAAGEDRSSGAGDDRRVPITLVTGFLGSGKTTLGTWSLPPPAALLPLSLPCWA